MHRRLGASKFLLVALSAVPSGAAAVVAPPSPRLTESPRLSAYIGLADSAAKTWPLVKVGVQCSSLGGGCGLFTTEDVDEGELLLVMPYSACITRGSAFEDATAGPALRRIANRRGDSSALAGWMAMQHLCDDSRGSFLEAHPFAEDEEPTHFLWWNEAEIAAHLRGLALAEARQVRMEVAREVTFLRRALMPIVEARLVAKGRLDGYDTTSLQADLSRSLRGAFVCILSRAFGTPGAAEEEEEAEDVDSYVRACQNPMLVPILDACQHAYPPNIVHGTEAFLIDGKETICYVCRAAESLASGSELFNDYGATIKPDFVLATNYGFAPNFGRGDADEMPSPYSCAARLQLPWALVDSVGNDGHNRWASMPPMLTDAPNGGVDETFEQAKMRLLKQEYGDAAADAVQLAALLQCDVTYLQLLIGPAAGGPVGRLAATARWAALTPSDVARSGGGRDLEAMAVDVLRRLRRVDDENDARAADAIRLAAGWQLQELEPQEDEEADVPSARVDAVEIDVRRGDVHGAARAALGAALRLSEGAVLAALVANADNVFALGGLDMDTEPDAS